jgi:undecaprenyl diphosphate synthase
MKRLLTCYIILFYLFPVHTMNKIHDNTSSSQLKHLACIMDGNRRWAMRQGLLSSDGHKQGLKVVDRVVDFCIQKNIAYLSLYSFSTENLQKRSQQEQHYLFEVLAQEALTEIDTFTRKNVRVRFIGDYTLFPKSMLVVCDEAERITENCTGLQVNFLLCYGGQQEIVAATQRIADEVVRGALQIDTITTNTFADYLWTADMPAPDLIIRTGGQQRLSNFLLFQCAYSELYFLDCLWPDIVQQDLEAAYSYFATCRHNFGQ